MFVISNRSLSLRLKPFVLPRLSFGGYSCWSSAWNLGIAPPHPHWLQYLQEKVCETCNKKGGKLSPAPKVASCASQKVVS